VSDYIPITAFHNGENGQPVRVVEYRSGAHGILAGTYVALELDAQETDHGGIVKLELRFKDSETLHDFFASGGPVSQALVRHNCDVANRPINVIRRAFTEGTFADEEAKYEMVVRDLVDAGHLPKEALVDL
jgi:hypothetical protein